MPLLSTLTTATAPGSGWFTYLVNDSGTSEYKGTLSAAFAACVAASSADTQLLFNDAETLGSDAGLTYNKTTDTLTVGGAITAGVVNLGTEVAATIYGTPVIHKGTITGTGLIASTLGAINYTSGLFQSDTLPYYGLVFHAVGNNSYGFWNYFFKSRTTDGNTPAAVQSNDNLGQLVFMGDNGTAYNYAAAIDVRVDGAVTTSVPGAIKFSTTAAGGSLT